MFDSDGEKLKNGRAYRICGKNRDGQRKWLEHNVYGCRVRSVIERAEGWGWTELTVCRDLF